MRNFITSILLLLCIAAIAQPKTDAQLTTQANVIRNETATGGNTKVRIADMYQAIIDSKVSLSAHVGSNSAVTASGTDTYTGTLSPAITSYATGQRYFITFTNANTGAATLNLNALGAKAIRKKGTTALSAGDISAGQTLCLYYDGTNLQVVGDGSATASIAWGAITGTLSAQTDVQTAIDGKVANAINNGTTAIAPAQDAVFDALALKADLASPALTGTPTAPTAAGSTNTTQIATTAFVKTSAPREYILACSDLTTALTTGATKAYFDMPRTFTVTGVKAAVLTAQTSGSILTIDIKEGGVSILSTQITIDNSETSSVTAATAPVISDTSIAADARVTIGITQVGTSPAGCLVTIIGY